MYYVYIVNCADLSLYCGITTDPARRLREHQSGRGAKYTRAHGACGYAALWRAADRSHALQLEYRIKQLDRRQKDLLIAGEVTSLDLTEYCRIDTAAFAQTGGLNYDSPPTD